MEKAAAVQRLNETTVVLRTKVTYANARHAEQKAVVDASTVELASFATPAAEDDDFDEDGAGDDIAATGGKCENETYREAMLVWQQQQQQHQQAQWQQFQQQMQEERAQHQLAIQTMQAILAKVESVEPDLVQQAAAIVVTVAQPAAYDTQTAPPPPAAPAPPGPSPTGVSKTKPAAKAKNKANQVAGKFEKDNKSATAAARRADDIKNED